MRKRRAWQWLFAALTFVGLVVIALRVEEAAGVRGLSDLLLPIAQRAPSVWQAITSTAALWVAVVVVAYTAGIWTEVLSKRRLEPKPFDTGKLAEDCEHMSGILRKAAHLLEHDTHNYMFKLRHDLMRLSLVLSRGPGRIPIELSCASEKAAFASADLLDELAAAIREGNRAKYKEATRRFSRLGQAGESPAPEGKPKEKPL
ncbi:MAG: hypothetical protein ACRECX_04110 [Methyloceanibacter sp.]|uniref:hypothetical protein n=1 Tax=Methyloceanibacter sp. TaxID=1965321 RepID=UPI003D6D314F